MIFSISRSIYESLKKHIVLYTFLASLPSAVFIFLDYFGKSLNLYDKAERLTNTGSNIVIISMVISLLLVLSKAIADKYDSDITQNGILIANKMLNVTKDTKESKYTYYKGFISDSKKISICKYMAPTQEISRLLRKFRSTLAEIIDIETNQIGISVFYKYDKKPYQRISTENIDSDPNNVISNETSTIAVIKKKDLSVLFFPDKRIGIEKKQYVLGSKDKDNHNIGSIYCEKIRVSNNSDLYIESYISALPAFLWVQFKSATEKKYGSSVIFKVPESAC